MVINQQNTNHKTRVAILLFLLLSIMEGVIATILLISITPDPKNAFIFGFSKNRIGLIGIQFFILAFFIFLFLYKDIREKISHWIVYSPKIIDNINWIGGIFFFFLWFTIWTPPYRFGIFAESFIRFRPLLIWCELIGFQFFVTIKFISEEIHLRKLILQNKKKKRIVIVFAVLLILVIISYILLFLLSPDFPGKQLYFPPGAPLSGLQVFLSWIIFIIFYFFENKERDQHSSQRKLNLILFFLIWALTFLIWNSIPLACGGDRPGPFPPNNICYPQINDSVFSIGSQYITLGQGIYHHWLTDKPLYMVFLSIGQWIFGPSIDQYLLIQIAIFALIPALLFLTFKKKFRYSGGIFISVLFLFYGINSINLYRQTDSVNVKIENSEQLTALFLIFLCYVIYKWMRHPDQHKWAILSGGILGCAFLVRITPIFIAPVLLLVVVFLKQDSRKQIILNLAYFILTFTLVFAPWLFSANDENGNNYYLLKIQDVISTRFMSNLNIKEILIDQPLPNLEKPLPFIPPPINSTANRLNYNNVNANEINKGGISGLFFHFMNNEFTGLAKLPTSLLFYDLNTQVQDPIWSFDETQPIWKHKLSLENYLSLLLSLVLVIAGIFLALDKFGIAGLSGLIVQTGYYLGNAFGQTSGGRYIEPVAWVMLLYYCLGIFSLTSIVINAFHRPITFLETPEPLPQNTKLGQITFKRESNKRIIIFLLITFFIIGLILPIFNNLPSKLPEERNSQLENKAYMYLSENNLVRSDQWLNFVQAPQSVVIQGMAYHPNYYRSSFYNNGNLNFELMVLAKDHVYVSYMSKVEPDDEFSDGSSVILIGCKIGEDSLWGADRIIIESFSIIQMDHENKFLINPSFSWMCNN